MKIKFPTLVLTVALLLTSVAAHALTPSYASTFTPANSITLSINNFATLSFAPTPANFTSAILNLNITSLENSWSKGKIKLPLPPSGVFETDYAYLFTQDLHRGENILDLNRYLFELNLANSSTGLNLGFSLDRGSVTFDKARLTGTVAPEPATMALVAAGLFGLPFARRFRDYLR